MSLTIEVPVSLEQNYAVTIGRNLWEDLGSFCSENYPSSKLFIVIDEKVRRLHGEGIKSECNKIFDDVHLIGIPEGEESKSIALWNKTLDIILKQGVERSTPLLAIGGGVTGDLGGFVAASALRGIPLLHMPTSLLAMVDSSIGGKTGINHETGKNLIGAFYQPDVVFADINYLETLDENEWINGLSEILKYAAISEPSLFDLAAKCVKSGFHPTKEWTDIIYKSATIKSKVVTDDTLEAGSRAFLNFGHTFGHALEKKAGFGTISHGEAVLVGMLAAMKASNELGSSLQIDRFKEFLNLYSIQLDKSATQIDELIESMKHDKKVLDRNIRLILLEDWGKPYVHICNDLTLLEQAWEFAFNTIQKH